MELLDLIKTFGWLIAIVVQLLIVWVAWSLRHKFVTREDCDRLCVGHAKAREKMNELLLSHAGEMREIKLKLDVVPTHDRMHDLELKLARIEGDQGKVMTTLAGLREILDRVDKQTMLLIRDRMGENE